MGLLFEHDGCQVELFAFGGCGVSYVNLTTAKRHYLSARSEVPHGWPQNVKDMLDNAQFVKHDACPVCLQPQMPLCRCIITADEDSGMCCTPVELTRIDPPNRIDGLDHLLGQAKKTVDVACVCSRAEHRFELAKNAIGLIETYVRRQQLIAQEAEQHYAQAANVLRNHSNACHQEIAALRERQRSGFVEHRKDLLDAVTGRRACDSCLENKVCCVARPCLHASLCAECWQEWVNRAAQVPTCPVCRAPVESVTVPVAEWAVVPLHQN